MAINCFYHIDKLRYVQVLLMIWWYDKMINKFGKIQKSFQCYMTKCNVEWDIKLRKFMQDINYPE